MANLAETLPETLAKYGLVLPVLPRSVANYVGYTVVENLVIISGQLPMRDGQIIYKGQLGKDVDLATGQDAARLCALNVLAQLHDACGGDLERIVKCARLGGFVCATENFTDHPKVINGASDLMVDVFGLEIGRHARAAVGVPSLPLGSAVEVEATFLIR